MKKSVLILGILFLLILTAGVSYWIGWGNGVNKIAVSSYIANGSVELAALHAIKEGQTDKAAELLKTNLDAARVGLEGYAKVIPQKYRDQYEKFLRAAREVEASRK